MHLHILGVGSIGGLVAHSLRQVLPPSHSITLIHKTLKQQALFLQRGSIGLERERNVVESTGTFLHEISAKEEGMSSKSTPVTTPIDSVIVTLKAQYTLDAIRYLAPRLNSNSTIVLLQNGMGIYELLSREVFRNPLQRPHFVLASNNHGAFQTSPFRVVHAGIGSIDFGIVPESYETRNFEAGLEDKTLRPEDRRLRLSDIALPSDPDYQRYKSLREVIAALLLAKNLNCSWVPFSSLQLAMRQKLVVNAAVNPLTSLMNCRNGDLLAHEPPRRVINQVCREASYVFAVQHRAEINRWLSEQNVDPATVTLPPFPDALSSESLEKEVFRVAELTKGNISSMLQDTRRGRRTEINFINGYLEDIGREFGIETPAISILRNLVETKYFLPLNQIL
ncbi:hypothetical protein CPC08DRAFT_627560 [Agrocybe pediades]|nr:hypothetical protein CPC08DRAFT_627560 [Agrocybe pediades]